MRSLFAPGGRLVQALPGFTPRTAQVDLACAVATAVEQKTVLVAEAGTGTGKTYAYLAPVLLAEGRALISTGTKTLQDQLYLRDLPVLMKALGISRDVRLLKGRSNYLCLYRFERAQADKSLTRRFSSRLAGLDLWRLSTKSGELVEAGIDAGANGGRDDTLIPRVTSTAENCLGMRCPQYDKCFVLAARRLAQEADVVVINHHLLLADAVVREEGFGELLPRAETVVLDEAHQLPELASGFFGLRVSTRQMRTLMADIRVELKTTPEAEALLKALDEMETPVAQIEDGLSTLAGRVRWREIAELPEARQHAVAVGEALDALQAALQPEVARSSALSALYDRTERLAISWKAATADDTPGQVRWAEAQGPGGAVQVTPLSVAEPFGRLVERHPGAWVLTSATLAAGESFAAFTGPLGLEAATTTRLDSPFDWPRQARLWLPPGMPDPNNPAYTDAVADAVLPLVRGSGGGVFVLTTSRRALERLAVRLRAAGLDPLVQGEAPRRDLLARFTASGHGLLIATAGFWEGVDVRGPALRVVVIDRLPFDQPGDPVAEARHDALRAAGRDPFRDQQVPQAIIRLRQGVGRLIRDITDQGLLVLADPRLTQKFYGRTILAALPPMPRLANEAELDDWLARLKAYATPPEPEGAPVAPTPVKPARKKPRQKAAT